MRRLLLSCTLALAACDGDGDAGPDARAAADARVTPDAAVVPDAAPPIVDARPPPDAAPPVLQRCTGRAFPAQTPGDFEHTASEIIALASAEHAAEDALVAGTAAFSVSAKFQYGSLFKDLEDEQVRVYLDDCSGWQLVATQTTNGDGRIRTTFDGLAYGVYDVRYVVAGDATTAPARLYVLPPATRITVFDIDGTLTTSDFEIVTQLFADLVSGDYVPEAYPSAAAMTRAYRDIGMIGVYVTGRPYWITKASRAWLRDLDFAPGPLFLAPNNSAALPTESGVGTFKRELLEGFVAAGFVLDSAQGNATTDIYAYLGAGLAPERTWIIGPHAGEMGTHGVTASWADHTTSVASRPPVQQPFD